MKCGICKWFSNSAIIALIIAALLSLSPCNTQVQAQASAFTLQNLTLTILLESENYERFASWIRPYSENFHNFTFIINRETGNFQWVLGNQTRIDFLTGIGEVIPLIGAVKPDSHTRGFLQLESPDDRLEIVEAAVAEWKTYLSHVPAGVFMFQPDTVVSNYLKSQNVSYILGYCFEQYTVDWMTMRGGWQLPYYANSEHALIPESQSEHGTLILPWLTWDWIDSLTLSHNYDTHIIDTQYTDLPKENRADYIIQLIERNMQSCLPVGYSAFSFEFAWLSYYADAVDSSIFDDVSKILSYLIGNSTYSKFSAGNLTKWFNENYGSTPAYTVRFASPNSKQTVEWFYSQSFRVSRINNTVVSFVDYTNQHPDKYLQNSAAVNFSEPRSTTNCVDNSLNFTIDALGGGMHRSPVNGKGVLYSGNLPDFMNYYYSSSQGTSTLSPPSYPAYTDMPSSNTMSPKLTTIGPEESPAIPESLGYVALFIASGVITCLAFVIKNKMRRSAT